MQLEAVKGIEAANSTVPMFRVSTRVSLICLKVARIWISTFVAWAHYIQERKNATFVCSLSWVKDRLISVIEIKCHWIPTTVSVSE